MLNYSGSIEMGETHSNLLYISKEILDFLERTYIMSVNLAKDGESFSFNVLDDNSPSTGDLFDLLYKSGKLYPILSKKTFCGLLSDLCLYMHSSLREAFEMKPHIAFTLARKPLIDDLFYVMYLYKRPGECIDIILNNDAFKKDVNSKQNRDLDLQLCKEIALENNAKEYINVFYNLRRSKDEKSLQFYCDKSLHIATSRSKVYNTQSGELNFAFMDDECVKDYLECYLTIVPPILAFSMNLTLDLFNKLFCAVPELTVYATDLNDRFEKMYNELIKNSKK